MKDNADSLYGRSLEEVAKTSSGHATAALYGKLYFHDRGMPQTFIGRLSNLNPSSLLLSR